MIDLGADICDSEGEDEGDKGESEDGEFKGNKAANEFMIAGAAAGVEREDTGVGEEAALTGVTSRSEGTTDCRPSDLSGTCKCFADDVKGNGEDRVRLNAESLLADFGPV
jgi:hypothetical protein